MRPTTHSADDVFAYLVAYKRENDGRSPTVREIADGLGIPSTSIVAYHLKQLAADGRILINPAIARGISIPGGRWVYEPEGES